MYKVKSLRLYTLHFTFLGLGMGCNENKVPLNETLCYDGEAEKRVVHAIVSSARHSARDSTLSSAGRIAYDTYRQSE